MKIAEKTKDQLTGELEALRLRIAELEKLETERKQAEDKIRDSEKRYRLIAENAKDVIWTVDINSPEWLTYISPSVTPFLGYSVEEAMAKKMEEIFTPASFEFTMKALAEELAIEDMEKKDLSRSRTLGLDLNRKDGSVVPVEMNCSFVRDPNGRAVEILVIARDITERKQVDEALQAEKNKLESVIDAMEDGLTIQDKDYNIIYQNKLLRKLFGERLGEKCYQVYEGKEKLCDGCPVKKAFGDGKSHSSERRVVLPSGEVTFWENTANPIRNAEGKIVSCLEVTRNITERKRAEEALQKSQEELRKMFESVTDGISVIDLNGVITEVNQGTVETHGFSSKDELLGKSALELVAPRDHERVTTNMRKALKQGTVKGVEYTLLKADGSEFPGELSTSALKDAAGNWVGHITISRDITERKQAGEALRESQKFSSSLLENSPNPIFVVNPDTSVKYVNPAFEKLTGFTLAEITGRKAPYPWWLEEKREEITAHLKNAMVTGGRRSEKVFQKKNGERFFVALNSAPIVHEGKLLYFLINWLDITERKRAEKERSELEQKAHLASRLASVGEMASGIAHEINNPLTAVIGFAQLLMDENIPDDVKEDIGVIHKEAQRAAGVARNLLTFARKHALEKQPTNLNGIIEGVLKLRAYEQSVSNIKVNTRLALDLPEVMTDYSQMQQVFINIILNAETAMLGSGNGGTLTITTQKVNNTVRALFADSGPGIAKENVNRIFDPFFTTKEVGKGTGLGLSVCHGIVAEHGGRIYARSRLGKGATFIVELPANAH